MKNMNNDVGKECITCGIVHDADHPWCSDLICKCGRHQPCRYCVDALWIHRGVGHYIGSLVIVCANNRKAAESIIRDQLDKSGLKDEPLDVNKVVLSSNSVIVCDDGSY